MHETVNDRLSEYLDDELSVEERTTVERHLESCARCRADLAGLRAVTVRARTLSDVPPQANLWPGVAERIDASGTPSAAPRAVRRFSFTLPQLIAAGLALMVLSGGMVWLARLGGERTDFPTIAAESEPAPPIAPVNIADDAYDEAIADLQRTLDAGRGRLDAQTVRILEENLATIDRAIAQCREALDSDPANVYLSAYLAGTRARKLELLRHATALIDRRS
jgi:predicted anti-sigma-YlaC factor YlaD